MSVMQLKDGRWIVQFPKGTLPDKPNKMRVYFGRGVEAEKEAREYNQRLGLRPIERRPPSDSGSPLFKELFSAYLSAKFGTMEASTGKNLFIKMEKIILPEIGDTPAAKITKHRLDQYVEKRLKTQRRTVIRYGKDKAHLKYKPLFDADGNPMMIKRTTVHRELCDIQAVLNWAVDRNYITHNAAARHVKPKRDDDIIMPPTPGEVKRLLAAAPDHLKRALTVSYYTGIRPGQSELLGLMWADIDLEGNIIFVRSARKNGPPARLVPLHPKFAAALSIWKAEDEKAGEQTDLIIHYGCGSNAVISNCS